MAKRKKNKKHEKFPAKFTVDIPHDCNITVNFQVSSIENASLAGKCICYMDIGENMFLVLYLQDGQYAIINVDKIISLFPSRLLVNKIQEPARGEIE